MIYDVQVLGLIGLAYHCCGRRVLLRAFCGGLATAAGLASLVFWDAW
ncbi:hypothetical protein PV387_36290 [Streptomyces sp. ME02-6987-2C]|nr:MULTISPECIES: hypothetical protein [unclassified Streptomyces]MDX3345945.1 hypothetical protein [Streptomyces sp. ME02-6979A]MDX3371401.1 hypothetical protein [Streptomyces sp. ME02-6987-2C]MDX3411620.1 hypothetical protein [Streptomyces sp. ME02-6977A]MDX3421711.1 hypothetical protein [Streptomyces sp. ME02-6985-2c]